MWSFIDTNPTQVTGVLAFAAAALACAAAAARVSRDGAYAWTRLAALQLAFTLEIIVGLRHRLHEGVDAWLQQQGWYAGRQPLQLALLLIATLCGTAGWVVARRGRGAPRTVGPAGLASAAVAGLFVLETVSLHAVDALLYRPIGPLLWIAVLWLGCAAVVVASALRACRGVRGDACA